jgi:hypothetical protein
VIREFGDNIRPRLTTQTTLNNAQILTIVSNHDSRQSLGEHGIGRQDSRYSAITIVDSHWANTESVAKYWTTIKTSRQGDSRPGRTLNRHSSGREQTTHHARSTSLLTHGRTYRRTGVYEHTYGRTGGHTHGRTDGRTNARTDVQMGVRTCGRMGGRSASGCNAAMRNYARASVRPSVRPSVIRPSCPRCTTDGRADGRTDGRA